MPTYLLHGFRWPRPLIRIHIIIGNIDAAAPEWLIAPGSPEAMLDNFHERYPDIMEHLPNLRFVEQYDPLEMVKGQPYAYVADIVHEIKLGVDIDEIRGQGVPNPQWSALVDLRDTLCPDEKLAWYVVVCGDVNRFWEDADSQILPANNAALAETDRKRGKKSKLNGMDQGNGSREWSLSPFGRHTSSNYSNDGALDSPSGRSKRGNSISRFKALFGSSNKGSANGHDKTLKKSKSEKNLGRPNTSSGASATALSPISYQMSPSPPPPLPGSAY